MGDRRGLGCAVRQGVDPACDTFQRTVLEESLNPHLSLYFHIYKMGLRDRTKCQSCWGSVTRKRICPQSVQCKPGPPRMLTPFLSSLIPFLCLLLSPTSFLFVLILRRFSSCLLCGGFLDQWHSRHYGLPFRGLNSQSAIFIILVDSSSSSWHWLDLQDSVLLRANPQPGKVLLLHNL